LIQKRIVAPTDIFGLGYINCGTSFHKGCWVKLDGKWAAKAGPAGLEGYPGYANAGDIKFSPATSSDGSTVPAFPCDANEFQREGSNLSLDLLTSGEGVITFKGGIFETDQYSTDITSNLSIGAPLYLTSTSILASGEGDGTVAHTGVPVRAYFLGLKSGYDSDHVGKPLMMFEMARF